jgi:hypothetical protein
MRPSRQDLSETLQQGQGFQSVSQPWYWMTNVIKVVQRWTSPDAGPRHTDLHFCRLASQLFVSTSSYRPWTVYRWDNLNFMSYQTLMMGTEMVPEMSVIFNQLAWLIAWEDFICFSCCESFRSYNSLLSKWNEYINKYGIHNVQTAPHRGNDNRKTGHSPIRYNITLNSSAIIAQTITNK